MSQSESYKVYRKIKQWHTGMGYVSNYPDFNCFVESEKA